MHGLIPLHLGHFSLNRPPFTPSPDPGFFYLTSAARDAADRLDVELERHAGPHFLAGRVGSGTTALLQYLAANYPGKRPWYGIDRTRQDGPCLLALVWKTLEAHAATRSSHTSDHSWPPVIAIDHADAQESADLHELLQWHAATAAQACPCTLLFVGANPLARCRVAAPQSLVGREMVEVTLRPLASTDTGALINYRLRCAGHQGAPLFTSEAVEYLQTLSNGLAGEILHLADIALYLGAHHNLAAINGRCMERVAKYVLISSPVSAPPAPLAQKDAPFPTPPDRQASHRWLTLALLLLVGVSAAWWLFQDAPGENIAAMIETAPPASITPHIEEPSGDSPDITLPPSPQPGPDAQAQASSSGLEGQPVAGSPASGNDVSGLIVKISGDLSRYLVDDQVVKQMLQPENRSAQAQTQPSTKATKPIVNPPLREKGHSKAADLERAVIAGDRDEVQRLLRAGVPIDSSNALGDTALLKAVWHGRVDVVNDLLKHTPAINHRNKDGCTPLFNAAVKGHGTIAATLIDHGALIDLADRDGRTPLMAAIWNGHTDIVHLLLARKADPNRTTQDGWTPLMFAALKGHTNIGKALLSRGANPIAANREGLDSQHLASKHGHAAFIALLPQNER